VPASGKQDHQQVKDQAIFLSVGGKHRRALWRPIAPAAGGERTSRSR